MNSPKNPGFYWVKLSNEILVAEYRGNDLWSIPGYENNFQSSDFYEISKKEILQPLTFD